MAQLSAIKIEFDRYYGRALIAIAKEDWNLAANSLDIAARRLTELSSHRGGDAKGVTQDWIFDIVEEIKKIENHIRFEKSKQKAIAMQEAKKDKKSESKFAESAVPSTTFDDIAGLEDVKQAVMYKVIYPQKFPEVYEMFKKRTGGGILLYGLPGTGKTLIAEAIAHETGATFFSVKCSDLGSKWFGETEQNIRDVFESARACENAVIFFDEIEAYATSRRENSAMERSVPEFLAQMQGVGASEERNKILIIGATNKPWKLDGAFLRPGRFDEKIYVPLPDEKSRRNIIDGRLIGVPTEEDLDVEKFVGLTEGYNGADVDYLCEKAKENAIRRVILDANESKKLKSEDFERALITLKSSVLDCDREEMEKWVRENRF
ncbi:MAG: AAA family ATPase [Clostridia bacterium]|nr:AAA family ATPase [Clostridia bacterium]MBO7178362.1 AAA family ATPase [Clostridia bacterium]